jgi:uncharacterized repeat protein (TIGR02543 family)
MAGSTGAKDIVAVTSKGKTLYRASEASTPPAWPLINFYAELAEDEYIKTIEYSMGDIEVGARNVRSAYTEPFHGQVFCYYGQIVGTPQAHTAKATVLMPKAGVVAPDYQNSEHWSKRLEVDLPSALNKANAGVITYRVSSTNSQSLIGGDTTSDKNITASISLKSDNYNELSGYSLKALKGMYVYVRVPTNAGLRIDPNSINVSYGLEPRVKNGTSVSDGVVFDALTINNETVYRITLPNDIIGDRTKTFTAYPAISVTAKVGASATAKSGVVSYAEIFSFASITNAQTKSGTYAGDQGRVVPDTFGFINPGTPNENAYLALPPAANGFTIYEQAALAASASASADSGDDNWQVYTPGSKNYINLSTEKSIARYRVQLKNNTGTLMPDGFTVIIPVPKAEQNLPEISDVTEDWQFQWPMTLGGNVADELSSTNYTVAYDTSYGHLNDKDFAGWKTYDSVKDNLNDVRAIRITYTKPVPLDFTETITVPLSMNMDDAEKAQYGGKVNIFESLVYSSFGGTALYRQSEQVALCLNNGKVEGFVYGDVNRNNLYDAGDTALSGVVVKAYSTKGGAETIPVEVGTVTTDTSGHYEFLTINREWSVNVEFNNPGISTAPKRFIAWHSSWSSGSPAAGTPQDSNTSWWVNDVQSGGDEVNALLQEPYTVNWNTGDGTTQAAQHVFIGDKATRPADPVKTGHNFVNWYKDAGKTTLWNFDVEVILADTTVYASYNAKQAVVTYYKNYPHETLASTFATTTFTYGQTMTAPDTLYPATPPGYKTEGNWYTSAAPQDEKWVFGTPYALDSEAAISLYAQWAPDYDENSYWFNVTYSADNATSGTAPSDTTEYEKGISDTVTVLGNTGSLVRAGYTFTDWSTTKNATAAQYVAGDSFTIAEDTTLYPVWLPRLDTAYTLEHYQVSAGGTNLVEKEHLEGRTDITVVALPRTYTGYRHSPEHSQTVASGTLAGDGSLVLRLYYLINTYTVSFADGYTDTILATQEVEHGSSATPPANPARPGYSFNGWQGSYSDVTSDVTVVATWQQVVAPVVDEPQYALSYLPGAEGVTGLAAGARYTPGNLVTVATAPARPGYSFTGWLSSAGGMLQPGNVFEMPAANVSLTAQWQARTSSTMVAPVETDPPRDTPATTTAAPAASASSAAGLSESEMSMTENQTGNPTKDILAGSVPLGGPGATGVWSLVSTILMLLSFISVLVLVIVLAVRRRREGNPGTAISRRQKQALISGLVGIASGITTMTVWALCEDLSKPMAVFNTVSPIIAALFAVTLALTIIALIKGRQGQGRDVGAQVLA